MDPLWKISTTEHGGGKESIMRRGNVYQIANGYMGYRGTLDEFGPGECVGVTLAGIFDQVGAAWREPVNAPNGGYTQVQVDGVTLYAGAAPARRRGAADPRTPAARICRHEQTLHFQHARFERETEFAVRGQRVRLRSSRFLSADIPNLGVIEFSLTCEKAAAVTIRTGIDGNIWDLNGPHLRELTAGQEDAVLSLHGVTQEQAKPVVVAETIEAAFAEPVPEAKRNRNLHVLRLRAVPGRTYTFHKYFAVFTAHDRVDGSLHAAAATAVRQAKARGYAACLAAHEAEWARRWSRSDVRIGGDPAAQQALRYSILQLLMVAPVAGSANSIPARALSGQVYKGAIFWDTEMFMFPFFLHTCPEKAVELLRYRIRTLPGARRKAQTEGPGYRGAFYAWESQETGDEACTYFNIGDPFTGRELRTHFRDKQVHISGDVAIAMWEYFRITGDDTLLLEGGAEVILECARFFQSYAYFNEDKQRYEILDVVGPDEYHERVNNNAFTNQVARETFLTALATVEYLRRRHPRSLRALVKKLAIGRELRAFRKAADLLYVPAPDPRTGVIEQFDGYFKLRDTTIADLKAKMVHPNEYLGAGQGLAVPTQVIKQADVVMMLNLFRDRFSAQLKQANWEYYEPRTEHGSSLSACAYAMVATEFGKLDFAYEYFLKTAKIDLEAKYKVYVGTIFMGGSHPAANGGAWMTAVLGFGGVRLGESGITLQPRLCPRWRSLEFRLVHRGDALGVRITRHAVTVTPDPANVRAHRLLIAGQVAVAAPGQPVTVEYQPAATGG